jgi:hypothetical protein
LEITHIQHLPRQRLEISSRLARSATVNELWGMGVPEGGNADILEVVDLRNFKRRLPTAADSYLSS